MAFKSSSESHLLKNPFIASSIIQRHIERKPKIVIWVLRSYAWINEKNTWPWSCHWFKGFCCQIKKLMLNKKNQCGSWNNLKNWKTKNKISSSKVWKETLNNNLKKPLATWSAKPDKKYDPNHKLLRNKASQSQKKKSRKPQNKSF